MSNVFSKTYWSYFSMQILHYFVFCLVSIIEFCVSLLRENDNLLMEGCSWKTFFAKACDFMTQVFSIKKLSESSFQPCHVLGPVHISIITKCLSLEINTISSDVQIDVKKEHYMLFIRAALQACKYITLCMQSSQNSLTSSHLHLYSKLCVWMIEFFRKRAWFEDLRAVVIDIVSDGLICELQCLVATEPDINPNDIDCNLSFLPLHKALSYSTKENEEQIVKIINNNSIALKKTLTGCIATISNLSTVTEIYSLSLLKASICDSIIPLKSTSLQLFSDILLRKNETVKLMKSFLRALSLYKSDWPGGKQLYIKFYGTSVQLVKTNLLALQIFTQLKSCDMERAVTDFTRTLILSLTLYVSLPWIESFNLEDFGIDFNAAGLKKSTVVPISASLRECEMDISNVKSLNEECNLALCDCIISLAILPGGKYTRWRSTILIKWALGEESKIALPALSIIPFFLSDFTDHSSIDTILSHVKIIFKRSKEEVTSTKNCNSCLLGCYLILDSLLRNSRPHLRHLGKDEVRYYGGCSQCELIVPSISSTLFISTGYCESSDKSPKPSKQLCDTISDVMVSSFRYFNPSWCGSGDENIDENEKKDHCYSLMRDHFLELVSNFLNMSDKRTMSENQKIILRSWIMLLRFYSRDNMDELMSRILQESSRMSGWNTSLMKELEEMLT